MLFLEMEIIIKCDSQVPVVPYVIASGMMIANKVQVITMKINVLLQVLILHFLWSSSEDTFLQSFRDGYLFDAFSTYKNNL